MVGYLILGLRLKNWRSHETSEFTFSKGTNLLIGSIGAGKSSVLDAMCFALFGTFPALKNRRVTLEEIIMARPKQKAKAEVELKFTCDGSEYMAKRDVEKGASEAWLYKDGKLLEGPQAQRVNEVIESLLKVDYELFSRAIYSEQNRIDYLLNLPKGSRKTQIDQLLGIARFEDARKNAASALNKIKVARGEAESYMQGADAEGLEKKVLQLKGELESLANKKNSTARELKEKESSAAGVKSKIEALEKQAQRVRSLETELENARATQAALNTQIRALGVAEVPPAGKAQALLNEANTELSRLEQVQRDLNELRVQENALEREMALADEELKALDKTRSGEECSKKILELQRKIEQGDSELKKKRQEVLALTSKLANLESETARAEKAASEEKALEARMHAIREKYGEPSAKLLAVERELEALNHAVASLKAGEAELEAALETLSKSGAACPVCESELGEGKRSALKKKRSEGLEETRRKAVEAEAKAKQALELKKKLAEAASEENSLKPRLEESKALASNLSKLSAEKARVASEVSSLNKLAEKLELASKSLNGELLALNKELHAAQRVGVLQAKLNDARARHSALAKKKSGVAAGFSEELLNAAKVRVRKAENALQAAGLKEKLVTEKERETRASAEVSKIAFDERALNNFRAQFVSLSSDVAKLKSDLEHSASFEKEKSALLKDAEDKLKKAKEEEQKLASLDESSRRMSLFEEALVATQSALRNQLIDCVNEALLQLWPAIYPYRDYSAVRMEAGEEDYVLQLQTNSTTWVPIEVASGGERSCAALALRIAFATVLTPNLSWLVLDEPTHNLDREAVLLLSRAMREEIPKIVEQIFIITHDEDLKEAASAKVWHVDRDKERGDVTNIEELNEAQ